MSESTKSNNGGETAMSEEDKKRLDAEFFKGLQVKLFVIGDSGVGKSCLMLRYVNDVFETSYLSTIGLDYKRKEMKLYCPMTEKEENCQVQIWDTAGQERFLSITVSQYREAHGVMLVYDLTEETSFIHVMRWLKNIRENTEKEVAIFLAGNKSDMRHRRVVEESMGSLLADENGMKFVECSAKTGDGVKEAFETLVKDAFPIAIEDHLEKLRFKNMEDDHISDIKNGKSRGKKCC